MKPASAARNTNFSQIGTRPSSTGYDWMSAPANASWMRVHALAQPRQLAERLAEDDAAVRAGLDDEARRLERGRDVGGAAERARLAGDRRHLAGAVDAVLDREHRRSTSPSIGVSSGSAVGLS